MLVVSPRVRAQDLAAAEALFMEGKALLDRGEIDAACGKLAESQRLDASSGTLLNLAACHEKQGKTASAWAEYLAAARLARTQGKVAREHEARRRASEIEPKLSYLTIRTSSKATDLEIERDDIELEASSIGSRIPIDPGKHVIVAKSRGFEPVTLEVVVGPTADDQTVVIPPLAPARSDSRSPAPEAPPAFPAAPVAKETTRATVPAKLPTHGAPQTERTLAWVIGGTGAALVVAGSIFGALALSAYNEAAAACPTHSGCSPDAMALRVRAEGRASIANVAVGFGVVGIGVSAVILLISGSSGVAPPRTALTAEIGRRSAGITVGGALF